MNLRPSSMLDRFLGRGEAAVTVPVMDGPFRPNQMLEMAPVLLSQPMADNLVSTADGRGWMSSGNKILRLEPGAQGLTARHEAAFDEAVSCLAHDGDAALAVGLDGGGIAIRGGRHDGKIVLADRHLTCPTACLFLDADMLLVANGSTRHRPSEWKHDLMSRGCSGGIFRVDLNGGVPSKLAGDLAFPYGLAAARGNLYFSESWAHRVHSVPATGGSAKVVLDELPGYPSRLVPASAGGFWLTVFAPRTQIVEFVLGEPLYRKRMMNEIDPAYWVAPDLTTGASYLEPMQGGALKQMGILKPWAPPRSYGLLVYCDEGMIPRRSLHSRADGTRHGITSAAELGGRVLATAKGPGLLIDVTESVYAKGGVAHAVT